MLSKLIFWPMSDVPDLNPYEFSDNQTMHDSGHYFALEHPRFIQEAKKVIFTNLLNNRHDIVSQMTGMRFSSIDVREYAKQQDSFLVHLALLFICTGGRTGRGRETLSVIFYNKPSALRNIFLLNGQFMIATGYHKGQSITDREKVSFYNQTPLIPTTLLDSCLGRYPGCYSFISSWLFLFSKKSTRTLTQMDIFSLHQQRQLNHLGMTLTGRTTMKTMTMKKIRTWQRIA